MVNHTNLVKFRLNNALNYVLDAESGQRGFLLTRDSIFLDQYKSAFEKANENLAEALSLTSDNPIQQQQGVKLRAIIHARFDALNDVVKYTNKELHTRDSVHLLLKKGKMVMDTTQAIALEMIETEDKLLKERTLEKERASVFTPVLVLLFSIFAILFVIVAYIKMRSETSLRKTAQDSEAISKKLQQEGAELNILLETKVDERTRELLEKNVVLENMNDELLSFNYVASHDLQEPLRKIQAFSNRILESGETFSEKTADYFSRITGAASRMQNLLEALISYSRASNVDDDFVLTDLNKILKDVKSDLHEIIVEKKAVIKSAQLPELKVIPTQVHQLLLNLISNAIKYSKLETPPKINISATLFSDDDIKKPVYLHHKTYWKISFQDNGIGFEKAYEDKIFELFQRLHGKDEFEGTGIGLAICRKIVQNHNGYISAEGRPGNGATFFIYFPA